MDGLSNISKMKKSVNLVNSVLKPLAETQDCRFVSVNLWFSTCESRPLGGMS